MQEERDIKERLLDDISHQKVPPPRHACASPACGLPSRHLSRHACTVLLQQMLEMLGDQNLATKLSKFVDTQDLETILLDTKGEVG